MPPDNSALLSPGPARKPLWQNWKAIGGLGAVLLIGFVIYSLSAPRYGSMYYGVCKTFVELMTPYPSTLQFFEVEPGANNLRFSYKVTDAFGQTTLNLINCTFQTDAQGALTLLLEGVDINRARQYPQESKEFIERFNRGVPAIIANPPDLRLPPPIPTALADMKP